MAMTALRLVRSSGSRTRPLLFLFQQLNITRKALTGVPVGGLFDPIPKDIRTLCTSALSPLPPSPGECIPVIYPDRDVMATYDDDVRPCLVANAQSDACIHDIANFALEEINRREAAHLELVRVLGAWIRPVFSRKYDITFEAIALHRKKFHRKKFYRASVCVVVRDDIVDLVQWEATKCPHPVSYFDPATYAGYARRLKRFEENCYEEPKTTSKLQTAVLRWFKTDCVEDIMTYYYIN